MCVLAPLLSAVGPADGDEASMARRGQGGANERKRINLALQGGGAHGAFTWGVLDRLLQDDRLEVEGITATSAGAMNAAMLAQGLMDGGRDGARDALDRFWRRVCEVSAPLRQAFDLLRLPGPSGNAFDLGGSLGFAAFDFATRMFSPYQLNPLNVNPLRDLLVEMLDEARLQCCQAVKLFIGATNVKTCRIKVFETHEVTVDVLMAAACLPSLYQAVEIDGEPYWDGGYMGNPALYPLIYNCESTDVVIVHINPILREAVPVTACDILDRMNEISFNSSLMREMRVIEFVTRMIDQGIIPQDKMKRMFIHSIEDERAMAELGVSSKLNPDWRLLSYLRDAGRRRAGEWLEANFDKLGSESSVDVRAKFL
jgi:NTE family protein